MDCPKYCCFCFTTLCDWLKKKKKKKKKKKPRPTFSTNQNSSQNQFNCILFGSMSDWFAAVIASVVIGQRNYFGFTTLNNTNFDILKFHLATRFWEIKCFRIGLI